MRNLMVAVAAVLGLAVAWPGFSVERKTIAQVSIDALIKETQSPISTSDHLDLVWFVPIEFWQVATYDPTANADKRDSLMSSMEPYFMIITIQADISPVGVFNFFDSKPQAVYRSAAGTADPLEPITDLPKDIQMVILLMKPILAQALGSLGQSINYYVYTDRKPDGSRRVSPYDAGVIEVAMQGRDQQVRSQHRIEMPLDTLHVPRTCANGRPAHVSWTHCPWDGTRLPD